MTATHIVSPPALGGGHAAAWFFDLDGTLVDSLAGIELAVRAAAAEVAPGLDVPPLRAHMGPPIGQVLRAALPATPGVILDAVARAFRAHYDRDGWRATRCFPGAARLVSTLATAGASCIVLTNKPRASTLRILDMVGLSSWLDAVSCPESVAAGAAPPAKADRLAAMLASRQLDPARCTVVGDGRDDAEAAARVGARFVAVSYGYGGADRIDDLPRAAVVGSLVELLALAREPESTSRAGSAGEGRR